MLQTASTMAVSRPGGGTQHCDLYVEPAASRCALKSVMSMLHSLVTPPTCLWRPKGQGLEGKVQMHHTPVLRWRGRGLQPIHALYQAEPRWPVATVVSRTDGHLAEVWRQPCDEQAC